MTLTQLAAQLKEARQDVALYQRLQNAAARVEELEKQLVVEQAGHDRAKAQAELAARYDGITDIRVDEREASDQPGNLLATSFTITYTKPRYDSHTRQSPLTEYPVRGFQGLYRPAMLYLLEKHPERIPASIMALSSNDPAEAMRLFLLHKQRGYM